MAAKLVLDARERKLIKLFGDGEINLETLEVGDALCTYEDGSGWVAERKAAKDFANSIKDGRWSEQKDRLWKSGYTVIFIVEGLVGLENVVELWTFFRFRRDVFLTFSFTFFKRFQNFKHLKKKNVHNVFKAN